MMFSYQNMLILPKLLVNTMGQTHLQRHNKENTIPRIGQHKNYFLYYSFISIIYSATFFVIWSRYVELKQ